jgi:hypothetical protein
MTRYRKLFTEISFPSVGTDPLPKLSTRIKVETES